MEWMHDVHDQKPRFGGSDSRKAGKRKASRSSCVQPPVPKPAVDVMAAWATAPA